MPPHPPSTKPFTFRLPNTLRAELEKKARLTRRSMTSLVLEGVEHVVGAKTQAAEKLDMARLVEKYQGVGRVGEGLDAKAMAERMRLIRGDD